MTKKVSILMSAAAAALLAPTAAAWEEDTSHVYVDQVQLGEVWSKLNVHVDDHAEGDVAVGATSVGNTASGLIMSGDIVYAAKQEMHGDTGAVTNIGGGDVDGNLYASTTAYANASTAGTWDGSLGYRAEQLNAGDVHATTNIDVRNVGHAATTTTAIANVSTPETEFGDNKSYSEQTNTGSSFATTNATICCDNESANFSTVAGGNAVTSVGSSSTVINGAVQQQDFQTNIQATSQVHVVYATDVTSSSTAAANSYTLHNEWGYATLGREESPLYQGNGANVQAASLVQLDDWGGHGVSTAYGVGNSALIGNAASDTGLFANQENAGTVTSYASLSGSSFTGGTGVVNSTAIGNAATATLCTMCGDAALQGKVNQYNAGATYAGADVYAGHAGNIYGSATAIGNSATFTSGD